MGINNQLTFHNKEIKIYLSDAAIQASKVLKSNLVIEIQIYFSCLLSKRLAFYTDQAMQGTWQLEQDEFAELMDKTQQLADHIFIRFNTVMTKSCPVSDYIGPPPVSDFEIQNQTPYVPSWLNIDYKNGQWQGEYGWQSSDVKYKNTKQVRGKAIESTQLVRV